MSFATKHPRDLTEEDVAELSQALAGTRVGALRPWTDYLLTFLTPEQAVDAFRGLLGGLWPRIATDIVLSGRLGDRDDPPAKDYQHLLEDPEMPPEVAFDLVQEYVANHLGEPYVTSLGLLFDAMSHEERIEALDHGNPDSPGLVILLVQFLVQFRPALFLSLLPAVERNTSGKTSGVVEALIATGTPEGQEAAERIALRTTDPFSRFLAYEHLHKVAPERHFSATCDAALASMAAPEEENNHRVAAEWLCRHAGDAGIAAVVQYVETRKTIWVGSVADFSVQALGDRAGPVIQAAIKRGIRLHDWKGQAETLPRHDL